MVGYCSIDDAYGGLSRETVKPPPIEKVAERSQEDVVEFYEIDGVMDSELGYIVVLFMAGVTALMIKDIIRALS